MENLKGKSAVVVGASSGIGRASLRALAAAGARVTGVARNRDRLDRIVREAPGEVTAVAEDASRPEAVARLVQANGADIVVVCAGAHAKLAPLDEQTWESFSEVWNSDVKISFLVCQEALTRPLAPGSLVILLSSGAAIGGSPLSGGYAGAKRMQWLMASYAQGVSDKKKLGIRFVALIPKQLVVGTSIGETASAAYAASAGLSLEKYMERFGTPLMAEGVASAILQIARGETGTEGTALAVTGKGVEKI